MKKKVGVAFIIILLLVVVVLCGMIIFSKKKVNDFMNIPPSDVTRTYTRDGIELIFYAQEAILDCSGALGFTQQYVDSGDGINEYELKFYFLWQPVEEANPFLAECSKVIIGDKEFWYYDSVNDTGVLLHAVDDNHHLQIVITPLAQYDYKGKEEAITHTVAELIEAGLFEDVIKFEIHGAGALTSVNVEDMLLYIKDVTQEDIADAAGEIPHVKNQLLISADINSTYEDMQALQDKYSFDIVGYIELIKDYQVEFREEKTFDELEALAEEIEQESIVRSCTLNYIIQQQPTDEG